MNCGALDLNYMGLDVVGVLWAVVLKPQQLHCYVLPGLGWLLQQHVVFEPLLTRLIVITLVLLWWWCRKYKRVSSLLHSNYG